MRPLISPDDAQARLRTLFGGGFDSALSSPMAGFAVAAMIYVGAVADEPPETWARPTTVMWQSLDVLAQRRSDTDRVEWRDAAAKSKKRLLLLLGTWGMSTASMYEENSRESLRGDTWPMWRDLGAVRQRTGVKTTSQEPRWALEPHFADLFDPNLDDERLADAIQQWIDNHLDAGSRLKANLARLADGDIQAVRVKLPDGTVRVLEGSESSLILCGVIEQWAASKLHQPVVLAISEPGNKVFVSDAKTLAAVGVSIDPGTLLPDALIADLGPDKQSKVVFWVVEAVSTDGPISETRKAAFREWAKAQRIDPDRLRFLTAFRSRNAGPAKRRLKDLARGTFAWYLDEPEMELHWVPVADEARRV